MNQNRLAILTTVFNHTNNPYFSKNWNYFLEQLNKLDLLNDLFVCEILPDCTDSLVGRGSYKTHIVYNNYKIWHKECAINFLINKIPDHYTKVLLLDNDISFLGIEWIRDCADMLDEYISVQPFENIVYLLHDNHSVDYIDTGMVKNSMEKIDCFPNGNPGLALGYNREYLHQNNGLYNSCLVGGGDMISLAPFFTNIDSISEKIPDCTFIDEKNKEKLYIEKSKNYILQNKLKPCYYLNNTAYHMFHGYRSHRQYNTRFNIINKYLSYETVSFDGNFYHVIDSSFNELCSDFFKNRLSLQNNSEPIIICSCKYGADSPSVFWLNKKSILYTYNIKKIKLVINNIFNFQRYQILVNNKNYNIKYKGNDTCFTIEATDPQSIEIICDESRYVPPDSRELCCFIQSIEIENSKKNINKYNLKNIL